MRTIFALAALGATLYGSTASRAAYVESIRLDSSNRNFIEFGGGTLDVTDLVPDSSEIPNLPFISPAGASFESGAFGSSVKSFSGIINGPSFLGLKDKLSQVQAAVMGSD